MFLANCCTGRERLARLPRSAAGVLLLAGVTAPALGGGPGPGPAVPFSGCGVLAIGPQGCEIFIRDDGASAFIENVAPFQPGDRVWVNGILNPVSQICGPFQAPGIENNTIGECFEGCGTLEFGPQGCIVFRANDGNASFFIENTDGFGVGDSVWVSGCVNPQSTLCAPFTAPGLEDNTIAACFSGCGTIAPGPQGCPVFRPLGSNTFYFIENLGTFGSGDRVWVEGCLNPQSRLCLPFTAAGIERNSIAECFAGCGRLEPTPIPECVLFISDCGERFVLENTAPIGRENRLWVAGCVDRLCNQPCFDAIPCLRNNTVGQCLDACGVLVRGAECTLVATPIGEVVVQNLGNFEVGDFVRIIGCFDPECVTFCQQGVGCVTQNEIRPGCRCDMNCDGTVDFFDIDPFLLALFDRVRYAELYPECDPRNADANGDCNLDFFDIDSFLDCLFLDG